MKIKSGKTLVLLGTIIIGFLIVINFNKAGSSSSKQLSASEYKIIQEEKNKLISQISSLADENKELEEKIDMYNNTASSEEVVQLMKEQLQDYGMISGLNEVKGPGLVIKINDGKYSSSDPQYYKWSKIFHDTDAENLLYQIRAAGAEAISINDHRIISTSAVKCKWAFIVFEDGDEEYPTFNFYCIGDPDALEVELTKEGGYLNKLFIRGLDITIEKKEEIILKAGNIFELNYANEYKRK